ITQSDNAKQTIDLLADAKNKGATEEQIQALAQQAQGDLEQQRAALEAKIRDLQKAIEMLRTQSDRTGSGKATPPAEATSAPKPGGGFSGAAPGFGTKPAQPGAKPNVEQRLEQVEHKLDILLWEITNM